ncbi:hypothetical protein GJ654_18815 [Rhodoblastus acidophilus]|uniref:DNA circulation N-terminal domain-containing protein n=1 Tax=Rhodoblastus acidophilus TaxID=1074 RepID=A0A6N8DT86_RHOAC|nr:DNA circularization N-terminal domain-containing protein [Rhodoblastus acidophilus]MCW2276381.1 prophage DNA circulation protein [Rhodoblastus acidophilus]MTV33036.1 hypothetical protein [Rhodoblastus acidophilus]
MESVTDWTKRLRRASYKGFAFQVESGGPSGFGRHAVNHDYVGGEQGQAEDLGRKTGTHRITAYIANGSAYADGRALLGVCASKGSGDLVMPDGEVIACICTEVERKYNRDKQGYVAFELEFLPWGGSLGPFSVELFDRVCASVLSGLPALLSVAIGGMVSPPVAQIAAAAGLAESVASAVVSASSAAPLASDDAASVHTSGAQLTDSAASIATLADVADFAQAVAAQIQTVGAALPATDGNAFAVGLAANLAALAPSSASPGIAAQNVLASALLVAARGAAAGEIARAASSLELTDRQSAKEALDALVAATDPMIDVLGQVLGADASQALADAQIAAVRALNAAMLDTAPLIEVSTTLRYPAAAAAYALYGDPSRAGELLARNGVGTPLFMPNIFVALAE